MIWVLLVTLSLHCLLGNAQGVSHGSSTEEQEVCVKYTCPAIPPRSCKDVKRGNSNSHMVHAMMHDGMDVMCDTQTDGGGWTVIQRRTNGEEGFFRDWNSYKYGFGTYTGDFWVGLEKIHKWTTMACYELYIDLIYEDTPYYAKYSKFRVWGEDENYKLEISGYSGNAGDNMIVHNNQEFSTKDRDNDNWERDCANTYMGGWWYNNCHQAHLNGIWGSTEFGKGLNWKALTDFRDSVSSSFMKIRPCY